LAQEIFKVVLYFGLVFFVAVLLFLEELDFILVFNFDFVVEILRGRTKIFHILSLPSLTSVLCAVS